MDNNPLHQIVYISSGATALSDADIENILVVSRRNNAAADISGALFVAAGRFLQALEGPEAAVCATYKRILSDPRHRAKVKLYDRRVEERQFGRWAMACDRQRASFGSESFAAAAARLAAGLTDRNLKAQFDGFVKLHQ